MKLKEEDYVTSSHRIIVIEFLNKKRLTETGSLNDPRQTRMIRQNRYLAIATQPFKEGRYALPLIRPDFQQQMATST